VQLQTHVSAVVLLGYSSDESHFHATQLTSPEMLFEKECAMKRTLIAVCLLTVITPFVLASSNDNDPPGNENGLKELRKRVENLEAKAIALEKDNSNLKEQLSKLDTEMNEKFSLVLNGQLKVGALQVVLSNRHLDNPEKPLVDFSKNNINGISSHKVANVSGKVHAVWMTPARGGFRFEDWGYLVARGDESGNVIVGGSVDLNNKNIKPILMSVQYLYADK
jgi:hypothetical protein